MNVVTQTIPRPAARSSVAAHAQKEATRQKLKRIIVDKPLGVNLGGKGGSKGGVKVDNVSGNAKRAGLKAGDTVLYTSSYFGDELWPSDSLQFVKSTLNRAPSPVLIEYVDGPNETFDVKRLEKKPAPARFGGKISEKQKEFATHICIDCGYIYCDKKPFAEREQDYVCPQCQAPKSRFSKYNPATGERVMDFNQLFFNTGQALTVIVGLLSVGVIGYIGILASTLD